MELDDRTALFVGFKLDSQLRRQLDSISPADRQYVSTGEPAFLRICRMGEDEYVGKIVRDRLTTDRVNDVRRNVLSIMRRLCPDARLPEHMDILAYHGDDQGDRGAGG